MKESDKELQKGDSVPADMGYVTLPYNHEQFKDFVIGLLGKPQTISKEIYGVFEFDIEHLESLFYLINQRVSQQNESKLIQFRANVSYHDNSSVLFSSLDELLTYKEIRKVIPLSIDMTWLYLVQFQDKSVPEKQEIEVSIVATGSKFRRVINGVTTRELVEEIKTGLINFTIKHTARTWGADIESLLTNHFENSLKRESKTKKFISNNSGWIGFICGFLFFIMSLNGIRIAIKKSQEKLLSMVQNRFNEITDSGVNGLHDKIEFLSTYIVEHFSYNSEGIITICSITAFIISLFIGAWIQNTADSDRHSYLLLTREAKENKVVQENGELKKWRVFIFSLFVSIVASVAANYIYTYLINHN